MATIFDSKFCKKCNSLLLVNTDINGKGMFKCRTDPAHTEQIGPKRVVMLVRQYNEKIIPALNSRIEILLNDVTLPRIKMPCAYCKAEGKTNEFVIYTKIDNNDLSFQYLCSNKHTWTN
jgi:DNA-directed RNA polymerase subunit M/transcription elongation factor TFIIS